MSVREYIGARYVPVFAEPAEWDATRTYEPLTVVTYQGNSYTSRQAVPANIPITNTIYWAQTGNYNAQVEQYRQEVQAFDGRIDALEESEFSISDVRKYGAIEKDSTVDWNSIVAQIVQVSDCIYFPAGEWYINEQIDISGIHTIVGNGAKLTATTSIASIINFTPAHNQTGTQVSPVSCVDGIFFNGNKVAQKCLSINGANLRVSNCRFLDYINYGIYMSSLGLDCINCQFGEDSAYFGATCVGLRCTTDSHITACKFFGQKTCIQIGSNSNIVGCLFYPGDDNGNLSTAIAHYTNTKSHGINIIGNQFDTMGICFKDVCGTVCGNSFFYNTKTTIYHAEIVMFAFESSDIEYRSSMSFDDNQISIPYMANRIFHTFKALTAGATSFRSYTSEGNALFVADDAMPNTYLLFGLNSNCGNARYTDPNNFVGLFTACDNFANAALGVKMELANRGISFGLGCFVAIQSTGVNHTSDTIATDVISVLNNTNEKMYSKHVSGAGPLMLIPYNPRAISKISCNVQGTIEFRFMPVADRDSIISANSFDTSLSTLHTYTVVS